MENAYLSSNLKKLKHDNFNEITIVLGNESCDLDSAISAVSYAAFLYWQYIVIKNRVCTKEKRDEEKVLDDIFIPMLNVNRSDYVIKTEVVFCLNEHDILHTRLIFRDDVELEVLVKKKKVNVVLVDHHVLADRDKFLAPYVTEIIDHRPIDRSREWVYKPDTRTTFDDVGSCCTLVTQRIKDQAALLKPDQDFFKQYPNCAEMLHCAIILDTMNFLKRLRKATPQDEAMVLFLESSFKPKDYGRERKAKLDCLMEARANTSGLSAAQLLKKDSKIVADVYLASFPILVQEFFKKPEAIQSLSATLLQNACSVLILLGIDQGQVGRDVGVYSRDTNKQEKLKQFLATWSNPNLDLHPQSLDTAPGVAYFKQNNPIASRKQYIVAVNQYILKNS